MATAHGATHDHQPRRPSYTRPGWRRYVYSTNHKDIGTMYLVFSIFAALIGASFSVYMRLELMSPGRAVLQRRRRHAGRSFLEHDRDGPRPDHGVLRRDARPDRRLRQLVRAADDRGARHGVPAHEQHQLLAAAAGLHPAAALRPDRRRRRHRMDDLRAAVHPAGGGHGSRHLLAAHRGRLLDPGRHQLHHHDPEHARAGHDSAPHAAVRLVDPGDGVPAAAGAAGAGRRHHHAADRPQLRHPLLRARPAAATRRCSCTSSGSSDIPRCTS